MNYHELDRLTTAAVTGLQVIEAMADNPLLVTITEKNVSANSIRTVDDKMLADACRQAIANALRDWARRQLEVCVNSI